MDKNLASYKALNFTTESNRSSMMYEVKRARAVWDPSLAIPGTERRGGFRCPVGTRYGGQITDRFGRQCGWGVARRLANEISDLGERLEGVGDARRDRKLRKRNERMAGRLAGAPGAIERAAGRVGDVLDVTGREGGGRDRVGTEAPRPAGRLERAAGRLAEVVDPDKPPKGQARRTDTPNAPASPKAPRGRDGGRELTPAEWARLQPDAQRGNDSTQAERALTKPDAQRGRDGGRELTPAEWARLQPDAQRGRRQVNAEPRPRPAAARRPRRNLRESEERRMQREIDNPGAARTGPDAAPAARPRPAAPRRPANAGRRPANRRPRLNDVPEAAPAKPVRPKAPRAQENVKMPDFGGEGWDAITQPDGSIKYKKGNWTIEMLPAQNGKFRGLKANSNDDGVPAITQNYNGPQGQASLNRFLRDFENNALRGFGSDNAANSERLRQEAGAAVKPRAPRKPKAPARPPAARAARQEQENIARLQREKDQRNVPFLGFPETQLRDVLGSKWNQTAFDNRQKLLMHMTKVEIPNAMAQWDVEGIAGLEETLRVAREHHSNQRSRLIEHIRQFQQSPDAALANQILEENTLMQYSSALRKAQAARLRELRGPSPDMPSNEELAGGLETPAAKPRQRILGRLGARESGGKGYPPKKLAEFLGDMHDPVMAARYQRQQDEWSDQIVRDVGDWDKPDLPELEDVIRRREGQIELDRDRLDMEIRRFEKNPTREQALVVMARNYDLTIKDRVHRSLQQRARVLRGEERPKPAAREVTPTRGRTRVIVPRGRTRVPVPEGQSDNAANSERLRQEAGAAVDTAPRKPKAPARPLGESDDVIGRGVPEWQQFFEAQNEEDIPERVTRAMRAVQNGVSAADQQFNNEFNGGGENMLRIRDREEMVRKYDSGLVALDRAVDARRREYDAANPAQRDNYRLMQRNLIEAMAMRKHYGERRADIDAVLAQPAPEPLNPKMARKAEERVKAAIVKRQAVLGKYLNERYGVGNAPWKEMTLERRRNLLDKAYDRSATTAERAEAKRALELWAEAMYSHDAILGNNGKTYRIKARATLNRDGEIEVYADIERKNADGGWLTAGNSARSIFLESDYINNSSMFIRGQDDKNNGIQTIYNQHAFMYAKAAGFDKVKVGTTDDGPYVWGRIGFDSNTPIGSESTSRMNEQLQAFRRGDPSIIKNAEDANIIEYLIQKHEEDPTSVRHMDFIYALSNPEKVNQTKKRKRDNELRDWFVTNMPLRQGVYHFDKNLVKDDPRD